MSIFTWLADWLAYGVCGLAPASKLGSGVHFFIEDTSKIFVLLLLMIYAIGLVRAGLPIERIRTFLSGRSRFVSYILAALLGAVTPFCSCSSIPLFLGFTAARIPVGITMAFLITSPMINEAAVVMLGGMVGWGLTGVYVGFGMLGGVLGGIFFDAIKAERYLATEPPKKRCCCCSGGASEAEPVPPQITWRYRHDFAWEEMKDIFKRIWLWVVIGIALGAFLHGFVPDEFIAERLGGGQWWSVPLAVLIGIPTYANATGVIPVIGTLIQKGLPVGTAFAFMLATAAASLPEFIMLKKVMSLRLLVFFAGYLLVFFTLCGWILNLVY